VKPPRRQFLHLAASAAALPAMSRVAWAQTYPSRPITIVVGFAAGGSTVRFGMLSPTRPMKLELPVSPGGDPFPAWRVDSPLAKSVFAAIFGCSGVEDWRAS
jgi:hypothetical protein